MRKTILISGGGGFVGSHLSEYFVNKGDFVICLDNFISSDKRNIQQLLKRKNFRLIKHNIIDPIKFKLPKIDEVYNLACPASPNRYQSDPVFTLRTNVEGTLNMLELARKNKAKFLQTSTSEVYGDPLQHPQKETYFGNVDPLGKRSCYDEGKRAAESLCKDYFEQHSMDIKIVRLFNVYGPRMLFDDGRVISNFIVQSLKGKSITVYGDGRQSRSFMYIDDLIPALVKLMGLSRKKVGILPVNIGNPDERTIKELAKDIKNLSGSQSKITFIKYKNIPARLGDPQRRCPDISRARRLMKWKPKVSFYVGLEKTIADFTRRLKK